MEKLARIILTVLFSLFLPSAVIAHKQYIYQQVITQNGISTSVKCIISSNNKGYVWIGTNAGIFRFNGYEL